MSMPHETTVTCKRCGTTRSFIVWESLNVTLDREAKQNLLKGELTRFTCQKCGWSGLVVYSLLYHDMEKHLMIWLWTDAGDPDAKAVPPATLMKDYHLRYVATQNELIEKILIFDAGLDDRIIEFVKLLLYLQASERNQPFGGELFFGGLECDADGKESVGFEHVKTEGSETFAVPMEAYQNLATSLKRKFSGAMELDKWLRVDRNFARALIA